MMPDSFPSLPNQRQNTSRTNHLFSEQKKKKKALESAEQTTVVNIKQKPRQVSGNVTSAQAFKHKQASAFTPGAVRKSHLTRFTPPTPHNLNAHLIEDSNIPKP